MLFSLMLLACSESTDTADPSLANEAPIAVCAIASFLDGQLTLEATDSYDLDGDPLLYRWSLDLPLDWSGADFSDDFNADAVTTSVTPDELGTYIFGLQVSDGEAVSTTEYCVWNLVEPESVPVAEAGADQTVELGQEVCLDGSGSHDPSGLTLSYVWDLIGQPDNSQVTMEAETAAVCFTPDVRGVFTAGLRVETSLASSPTDVVHITVQGVNTQPIADAGTDVSGQDCTVLVLDASGSSDAENDTLEYFWEIQSKPVGSRISDEHSFEPDRFAAQPTLYADEAGVYVLSVSVFDGEVWSDPDLVTLNLAERAFNTAPVVTITTPSLIEAGEACCEQVWGNQVHCDSCATESSQLDDQVNITDPDGDPITILWESLDGDILIADPTALGTQFLFEDSKTGIGGSCDDSDYVLELTVRDCTGAITIETVTQTLECCGDLQDSC